MLSNILAKSLVILIALSSSYAYAASCTLSISNEWGEGFTSSITITNDTDQPIDGWTVTLDFGGGATINGIWDADLSGSDPYQVTNKNYNNLIQPGNTLTFGYNSVKTSPGTPAATPSLGGICGTVAGNQPPVAVASASPFSGAIPLTVNFDGSGSTDPEGDNLSYQWVLPDGTVLNGVSPTHTFTQAGSYPVNLTVNDGALNSIVDSLTINAQAVLSNTAHCEYLITNEWNNGFTSKIKIINNTPNPIDGWNLSLTFSDGSSITGMWDAKYSGSNPYQISNESYNKDIAPNQTIAFGFNTAKASENTPAAAPVLGGICGSSAVNQPPTASAVVNPLQGPAPLAVNFNASNATDPEGGNLTYQWAFGDGSSSNGVNVNHTYIKSGTYSVVLTVTDDAGQSDTASYTITVSQNVNQPPVASATATPQQGTAPLTVNFNANATDPENDSLSYSWDFGDNTSANNASATHIYANTGTYTAVLTVTDSANNTDTVSLTITVSQEVNQPPVASAVVTPQQGSTPLNVSFNASGSTDPENDNLTYSWDFGDGSSSSDVTTTHTYPNAGSYTVVLTVTDTAGNSHTATKTVTVTDPNALSAYTLDAASSSLHFVSTKKVHVVETHTFTTLSGDISADGVATLNIDLNSVETNIDIRNERMREHLFETATFSQAAITLNVDMATLDAISVGGAIQQDINATVDLHGFQVPTAARVSITRLTADRLLVQNISPILVKAADFGLTSGIDVLRDLAKLNVISYSVPTNFTLFFQKQ